MKVVIIEDEINASEYLVSILKKVIPDVLVLGAFDSIKSSVNFLQQNNDYDLLFMDIQIADGLSFEIFNHVSIDKPVIFTTAYDQYAVEAFKVYSIDYLLKPIHIDDLRQSMKKYESIIASKNKISNDSIAEVLNKMSKPKKNRCLVKKGGHFEYVNVTDIAFVESDDGLTFLYTFTKERFIYSKSLEQLFEEVDHDTFYMINRSQIVNSQAIKEIHPFLNQRLKLVLKDNLHGGKDFIVSRQKQTNFKLWMDR